MQGTPSPQETSRRVGRSIRAAKQIVIQKNGIAVFVLAALLGAGSSLALAQERVLKSSPLLHVYTAGDYDDTSHAQTAVGSTPVGGHVDMSVSWPDGTAGNHSLAGSRETVVIVPDLIDLDVTDAEQAVHSVGLYLKVTGIGDVVVQAPRAGTAVPIGSIVSVSLKNY